ncbi:DNA double-strand break repair nuclease NurA [Kordiimonas aestuarii]|uniref:DNA double-strand break repair nuclease NurA n=1 Tax=Kordiimonas aestuarii TaxID=1005925 RepID=UPI0021D169F4|nr:DNA double-strand break repair nuclease NurA [Kordiimonas aestuarii]
MGLFAAHRTSATSKQRAININSTLAQHLLSPEAVAKGGCDLNCVCVYNGIVVRSSRRLGKSGKNWRLGGTKIDGDAFAELDCKDLVLIRSVASNDGTHPVTIVFISKKHQRVLHAGVAAIVERLLSGSMAGFYEEEKPFGDLSLHCPAMDWSSEEQGQAGHEITIPPMPEDDEPNLSRKPKTIHEKIRSPHIMERMFKAAGDLSAPAQFRFMETVDALATQLRRILLETGGIVRVERNHSAFWSTLKGQRTGFVDGGLANLSMLGSAPIAARVGGYTVIPGISGDKREDFITLKSLIGELYAYEGAGVFGDSFPDVGALRDAARISIEAAGAVQLLSRYADLSWLLVHGALVNPVSRYTDVMQDGRVRHRFPDFSSAAIEKFLPEGEQGRTGRERNFISVHLRQLQLLETSSTVVCGVVERESSTTSVCRAVLDSLEDELIRDLLPVPPAEWKHWFRNAVDPSGDEDFEGQRITDSLLFRCVLEPGEALLPVIIDRNEARRAPEAWKAEILEYPKPLVFYLQATEWSAPIRIEIFEKDRARFNEIAALVLHCSLLLPRYAFPVGLDIVDKFARIPNWMSRPINTHTVVRTMRTALENEDMRLFDAVRRMLCGSGREFLLRPGIYK